MSKKVVKEIFLLNFCEIVEFEGSTDEKPDVLQLPRGQSVTMCLQVGSEFDEETGTWSGLKESWDESAEVKGGNFEKAWDPVPPVDPQVLAAKAKADAELEAQRTEAEAKAKAEDKKEFILP
jgi:hypothetical protein